MVCKSDSWSSKRFEYYISLWLAIRLKTSSSLFEGQNGWFFLAGKIFFGVIWLFIALHAGIGLVCLLLKILSCSHYIQRIPFYFFSAHLSRLVKSPKQWRGLGCLSLGTWPKNRQVVPFYHYRLIFPSIFAFCFGPNLSRLKGISFHWKATNFLPVKTLPFRFWKIDRFCCQTVEV